MPVDTCLLDSDPNSHTVTGAITKGPVSANRVALPDGSLPAAERPG